VGVHCVLLIHYFTFLLLYCTVLQCTVPYWSVLYSTVWNVTVSLPRELANGCHLFKEQAVLLFNLLLGCCPSHQIMEARKKPPSGL